MQSSLPNVHCVTIVNQSSTKGERLCDKTIDCPNNREPSVLGKPLKGKQGLLAMHAT